MVYGPHAWIGWIKVSGVARDQQRLMHLSRGPNDSVGQLDPAWFCEDSPHARQRWRRSPADRKSEERSATVSVCAVVPAITSIQLITLMAGLEYRANSVRAVRRLEVVYEDICVDDCFTTRSATSLIRRPSSGSGSGLTWEVNGLTFQRPNAASREGRFCSMKASRAAATASARENLGALQIAFRSSS